MTTIVIKNANLPKGFTVTYNTVNHKFTAKKDDIEFTAVTEDELESLVKEHLKVLEKGES